MNDTLASIVGGVSLLLVSLLLLGWEVRRTHGFGKNIGVFWVFVGVAMSVFMWAVLPTTGQRTAPLWFMLGFGVLVGAAVGGAWHFGYSPRRRRSWEEDSKSMSNPLESASVGDMSPEQIQQSQHEIKRNGTYFTAAGVVLYIILLRACITIPQAAIPAIPGMLLGGTVGLIIAWQFPFNPTRAIGRHDPLRQGVPRREIARREQYGRELLRLRKPEMLGLAHLPFL